MAATPPAWTPIPLPSVFPTRKQTLLHWRGFLGAWTRSGLLGHALEATRCSAIRSFKLAFIVVRCGSFCTCDAIYTGVSGKMIASLRPFYSVAFMVRAIVVRG